MCMRHTAILDKIKKCFTNCDYIYIFILCYYIPSLKPAILSQNTLLSKKLSLKLIQPTNPLAMNRIMLMSLILFMPVIRADCDTVCK
jgi:hypothetical protein